MKLIDTLNPDTSNLTQLEASAWDKMKQLVQARYSDSELLDQFFDSVLGNIGTYNDKIVQAQNATTIEELIQILESI